MFFKSNDNRPDDPREITGDPSLFSMERIGLRIMHARKQKGMTQMELADRMGISFQAVSNWERGQSCPDIAKLFELSELFDVSLDELLGNPRAAQIASEVMEGTPPALPVEELTEVAPLLDQKQADEAAQKNLSEPVREEEAPASEQPPVSAKERIDAIRPLLPFASEEIIDELAHSILKETQGTDEIKPLFPFMSNAGLDALARTLLKDTQELARIQPMLPFLSGKCIKELARSFLGDTKDLTRIQPLLPFLDEDDVNALLRSLLS